jgi:hypothetical protein
MYRSSLPNAAPTVLTGFAPAHRLGVADELRSAAASLWIIQSRRPIGVVDLETTM